LQKLMPIGGETVLEKENWKEDQERRHRQPCSSQGLEREVAGRKSRGPPAPVSSHLRVAEARSQEAVGFLKLF
jgi:hypothetical protein